MKILQVTKIFKPSWESGGPARVVCEISKRLEELESIKEEGRKAWRYNEIYSGDLIVNDFEKILEDAIRGG